MIDFIALQGGKFEMGLAEPGLEPVRTARQRCQSYLFTISLKSYNIPVLDSATSRT